MNLVIDTIANGGTFENQLRLSFTAFGQEKYTLSVFMVFRGFNESKYNNAKSCF